ncbi:MAG: adenylyltransferase/cytidyltransferase family protein, partial [Chthoniobacterales bacterium]|nr:adenylyltransferase/cytidyltransferase family protein [Chthoniobacterales bacterium]
MSSFAPLIPVEELPSWRANFPNSSRLVLTNGCFDILHSGHVLYLEQARALGDFLLVALNSDESVRALKGPSRPINPQLDRYTVLSRLRSVDAVTIFPTLRVTQVIFSSRPHIYAKG